MIQPSPPDQVRGRLCPLPIEGEETGELSGGVLGACNAPLQAYAATVQQNAAGVRGVPEILLLIPQEWGIKGVETESRDSLC
jgi:hypothetical protein